MADPVFAIRSVFIGRPPQAVFDGFVNLEDLPKWAVHHIKSAEQMPDGSCEIETPRGPGWVRMRADRERGVLDHEITDVEGTATVAARVSELAGGSVLALIFPKPADMPAATFEREMSLIDEELARFKQLLETGLEAAGS